MINFLTMKLDWRNNKMQIDNAILETDKVICKNISRFDDSERGLLSQNILA